MGLLSNGGVHSHNRHLYGLLELAKRKDFEDVYVHCFMDGRDTPPASGESYIAELEEKIKEKGVGQIASLSGRFYAMDRDKRWERVSEAYNAMVNGVGEKALSAVSAIEESYQKEAYSRLPASAPVRNSRSLHSYRMSYRCRLLYSFRSALCRSLHSHHACISLSHQGGLHRLQEDLYPRGEAGY